MAATTQPTSLRTRQQRAILEMLNDNTRVGESLEGTTDSWKVLIYDAFCRDVIAPLARVGDLRKMGVTLYLDLHSDRDPIHDATAVYFVRPTEQNITRICQDCAERLYDTVQLNFSSPLSAALMDHLAAELLASGTVGLVESIHDQYLGFVALEPTLFTLHHTDSYRRLNARTADAEIEAYVDTIVEGLLAVCVTMGTTPLITFPANGPAQMVAERLDARIREMRMQGTAVFDDSDAYAGSTERPVLVLCDRSLDMGVMLQHSWTYQTLVEDVLDYSLNRVSFEDEEGQRHAYDLDESDAFWREHAGTPFPQIGGLVEEMVSEYQELVERVRLLREGNTEAAGVGTGDGDATAALIGGTRDIASNLNEHSEQKRVMDVHTNLATCLLREIESRSLDTYFFAEETIADDRETTDITSLQEILLTKGSAEDKARLILFYVWNCKKLSNDTLSQLTEALREINVDVDAAISHMKEMRSFRRLMPKHMGGGNSRTGISWGQLLQSGKSLLKYTGVENWLPSNNLLPLTRVVSSVVEHRRNQSEAAGYQTIDPRSSTRRPHQGTPSLGGAQDVSCTRVVVFVVGGGSYIEAQNVHEYAKALSKKDGATPVTVTYGSTQLMPAAEFVRQISAV